ncbi:MAG: RiPP maturation radical SAM protein 1 [bacterium]|nr:RiPP maturation radical SAM protein 1 [bacterium]
MEETRNAPGNGLVYLQSPLPKTVVKGVNDMKIALLTMPFLLPLSPSLALTQLKSRLKKVFDQQVDVRLLYLNHDFYRYFGRELYSLVDSDAAYTLLNDWLFRQEAFDNIEANYEEYLGRFYPHMPFSEEDMGKVLNLGRFIRELIGKYQLAEYDVVGINATFTLVPGLAFCRHLKQINKNIVTVMGGAALYNDMGAALSKYFPHVDYTCSGSGLVSFPKLIDAIGKNDKEAMESIDGMFSATNRDKVGNISETLDINEPMELDYDDFFESFKGLDLEKELEPFILLETSRGCSWNKCNFCGLNEEQRKYRAKKPDVAVTEINYYFGKYGCNIFMVDNILPRNYVNKVLPKLQVPEGKMLTYEVRGDYTGKEMEILSKTKVKKIQPGIEAVSTSVHKVMNKGVTAFQCITMLKQCVTHGIIPNWNMIIGFPGMTEEMYKEILYMVPLLTHLFPPDVLTPLRFDRYSEYWNNKEKYKLELSPFSPYAYIYPYGEEFLEDIAYYFEDTDVTSERVYLMGEYYIKYEGLIDAWQKRWQRDKPEDFPRLTCLRKEGAAYIYDSRHEEVREYVISPAVEALLELLETPKSLASLETEFPHEAGHSPAGHLDDLERKGVIFKEGDVYMSLVIGDYSDSAIDFILANRH